MLINGYKFDLRIYVVITSVNPLRIYVYEEGLVRFATAKYKDLGTERFTKYTHLTNYSVNKKNANFLQNNDAAQDGYGSKWSLSALWKYCKNNGIDEVMIRRRIEDVIIKTML
jgi:tubulin polyglutamylase TTLL5